MTEALLSISIIAENKRNVSGIGQQMIMNGSASYIQNESTLTPSRL